MAFARRDLDLGPTSVNVDGVLSTLTTVLERLVGTDVKIHWVLDAPQGVVKISRGLLEQVVISLTLHVRDTMGSGGTLKIGTSAKPRFPRAVGDQSSDLVIDLADVTPGNRRPDEPLNGTGLGLSTALGIIQHAGGRLDLDTEHERATRFRIVLPTA
jgi:two-component system cell cycle sensor histidine kinase/response regulator CckA